MAEPKVRIDTTRWKKMIDDIVKHTPEVIEKEVAWAASIVNAKAVIYLNGPRYGFEKYATRVDIKSGSGKKSGRKPKRGPQTNAGTLPVPVVTGNLKGAQAHGLKKLAAFVYMVYTDDKKASYAKYVHDGTKYMKPRRYLYQAALESQDAIIARWDAAFTKAWNEIGK